MPKRNKFSRSHYNLLTCNMGDLIPIYCDEVIPGDVFQMRTSALIRVSPQVKPTMHPVRVRMHYWFVPYRLIWDDYEDFFTGGNSGDETPEHPWITCPNPIDVGSLWDYLGFPTGSYGSAAIGNALFVRAYQKIFNEHYRDQDLGSEVTVSTANGEDTTTYTSIRRVAWEKDRFTTARTTTQRGSDITIPLGDTADVIYNAGVGPGYMRKVSDDSLATTSEAITKGAAGLNSATDGLLYYSPQGTLSADLSSATGIPLEDLRLAIGKQRYMEIMNRAGARYGEYARAIFGVRNPDSRLQLPEYLGGGRQTIAFSEILSTADAGSADVGDLKGHGIAAMRTRRVRRFFPEHGIVMCLMSVVPRAIYTQAMERQLIRDDTTVKEDYFVPQLQGIGDDAIYNKEVYGFHSSPDAVFGYQNRYEEYRTKESRVSGEMRVSPGYNWHLGRVFTGDIALNQTFISCNPTKRILADNVSDTLQVMASHSIQTRRPVGRTGQPARL